MNTFPEWGRMVYRGVRTAIASAIAQTLTIKVDWSDTDQAIRTLVSSFIAGFLVALGMWIRDRFDEKSLLSKTLPV